MQFFHVGIQKRDTRRLGPIGEAVVRPDDGNAPRRYHEDKSLTSGTTPTKNSKQTHAES